MLKIQDLFASSGILLLVFGLVASRIKSLAGLTVQTGAHNKGFALEFQTPLYFVATLFSLFAFLHSIGYIPFSQTLSKWHFSMSAICVLTCTAATLLFRYYLPRLPDGEVGFTGQAVGFSYIGGILIFVGMQALFAVDLVLAVVKMRKV